MFPFWVDFSPAALLQFSPFIAVIATWFYMMLGGRGV